MKSLNNNKEIVKNLKNNGPQTKPADKHSKDNRLNRNEDFVEPTIQDKTEDTRKGCNIVLGKYTFSLIYPSIEVRCGDYIINEVKNINKRLFCSKCQNKIDKEGEKE